MLTENLATLGRTKRKCDRFLKTMILCHDFISVTSLLIAILNYYSTHCNTAQYCTRHSSSIHNRYPAIYVNFVCNGGRGGGGGGGRNGEIKIVSSFCAIKLCFFGNGLNKKKTVILLNLVEYLLSLAYPAYCLVRRAIFRSISQDNS